jgi:hypothetical protein
MSWRTCLNRCFLLALGGLLVLASEGQAQLRRKPPKKPPVPTPAPDTGGPLSADGNTGVVRGVFAMSVMSKPIPDAVLANPDITGVSLRVYWSDVEPVEGRYVWTFDNEIARAQKAGKQVMIRVSAGTHTPEWVYAAGVKTYEFVEHNAHMKEAGAKKVMPIPWDPIFLKKWTGFIQEMGRKYADNRSVVLVQMAGPNKAGGEILLPKSDVDKANWPRAGYTKERYVGAYKVVIDAYDTAFPKTPLALDACGPLYEDGAQEAIIEYAHEKIGKRFCVQHNGLAAKTKETWKVHEMVASYKGKATVGFQLLCPATAKNQFTEMGARFGGTLKQGFAIGLRGGATYFEVFIPDLEDATGARHTHELAAALGKGRSD